MKRKIKCIVNRREVETSLPVGMSALDFIRDRQKLPGTKEGCREGECGACTILLGELKNNTLRYKAVASCLLPLGELDGKHIVTVEGINNETLTPVQQALTDEGASQCGFCTPGIVLSLTGFFLTSGALDYEDARDALDGNICRCTGYVPIQRAARHLSDTFAPQLEKNGNRIGQLVRWNILPEYFLDMAVRLKSLSMDIPSPPLPTGDADGPVPVAGGTDLFVQQPEELKEKNLAFLSRFDEFSGIREEHDRFILGGAVTVEEMKQSPLILALSPRMKEHLNLISSTIMRNRATVAGNIVNASPIGDITIMLLPLDCRLHLIKGTAKRDVPLHAFYKGYKQMDLRDGELIQSVSFPAPAPGTVYRFEKVSQRRYLDIASVNTAMSLLMDGDVIRSVRLSAGGVGPVPMLLKKTAAFLTGKKVSTETLAEAVKIMATEIAPISDVRGSAEYKTLLLRNLIYAQFDAFGDRPAARGAT